MKDSRQADAISLVLMADPPKVIIGAPAYNKEAVLSEIDALTLPHGGTDLPATFRKVDEVLETSNIPRKEVVFLTDLQTASWRRIDPKADDGLKNALARLDAKKARSQVIDLGASGGKNWAVVDLALDPSIVTVGAPVVAKATVKNFGREPTGDLRVKLSVGDQIVDERPLRLGAGEAETVAFNINFPAAGPSAVVATVDDDALKLDDSRRVVASVRESLNVLIVDGDKKSEAFLSDSDFLAQALNPKVSDVPDDAEGPCSPRRSGPRWWARGSSSAAT